MIISTDAESAFNKNSTFIYDKNSQQGKVGIRGGVYPSIINAIYNKSTANSLFNSEKLKAFLVRSGTRQVRALSPLLLNRALGILDTEVRQREKVTGTQIGKEKVKLSLFAKDILYIENSEDSTKKLLEIEKR